MADPAKKPWATGPFALIPSSTVGSIVGDPTAPTTDAI
jgi:hypothetical protein